MLHNVKNEPVVLTIPANESFIGVPFTIYIPCDIPFRREITDIVAEVLIANEKWKDPSKG
jgi:hypothetical protein